MRLIPFVVPILLISVAILAQQRRPDPGTIHLENVADRAAVSFVLQNHPSAEKFSIEAMPGGVAAFDYNNDGLPDLYFTNGAAVPSLRKESSKDFNRLYRNDGGLKFTDVTEQAGLAGEGYSNGVAAADYDNDGNVDLFVAGGPRNLLYRNRGDGTFEEVSVKAGIVNEIWPVAAGWFDYDNDGFLDLFVVNYMKWNPVSNPFCGDTGRNLRVYCHPTVFQGLQNRLYHNRGDGTFEDVSERTGIAKFVGRGMSIAFNDYDGDGFMDAIVTNDHMPNFLFHNIGGKRFEEVGIAAGVALLDSGKPVSSMGVDFRDYDNDGRPDVTIADLAGETFPLFHNEGHGTFRDTTYLSGVGSASARHSGWCTALIDLNNDGNKDLFVSGGHVNDLIEQFENSRYKEPNMVFANLGGGKFRDVSSAVGETFATSARAHRGCAFADFDGDGLTDIAVSVMREPTELWHNTSVTAGRWLDVNLRGTKSNRDGIGAVIRVGNQYQIRSSAVGYASSSLVPVHFGGVGEHDQIEIHWPSGKLQHVPIAKINAVQVVIEPH